jgi:hypothetical protein
MAFAEYARAAWAGAAADAAAMGRTGEVLQRALAGARVVRVTSPEGTDFTFAVGDGPVHVAVAPRGVPPNASPRADRANLWQNVPGGMFTVVPAVSSSGHGRIRSAADFCTAAVRDEEVDVAAGVPTRVKTGSDEACVQQGLRGIRFGLMTIGLNPAIGVGDIARGDPLVQFHAGAVWLGFGGNTFAGGTDSSASQWAVPLTRATVVADGKVLVRDGRIVASDAMGQKAGP